MADAYHHAVSSAKAWGGKPEDYLHIHEWFDATKAHFADARHRAMRHHAEGIKWCVDELGPTITNSNGRVIPVRWVAEQHVREDMPKGHHIPTIKDWLENIQMQGWMVRAQPNIGRDD